MWKKITQFQAPWQPSAGHLECIAYVLVLVLTQGGCLATTWPPKDREIWVISSALCLYCTVNTYSIIFIQYIQYIQYVRYSCNRMGYVVQYVALDTSKWTCKQSTAQDVCLYRLVHSWQRPTRPRGTGPLRPPCYIPYNSRVKCLVYCTTVYTTPHYQYRQWMSVMRYCTSRCLGSELMQFCST